MRRAVLAVLALLFLLPLTVQAQEWTSEQEEVWENLKACWTATDVEIMMACVHEDLVTWNMGGPVPSNKADFRAFDVRWLDSQERVWSHFQPLNIDVRGDMAIVLYVWHWADRNRVTGEETTGFTNWTEVFVKEGNRWLLLADHGTMVDGG